MLAFAPFAVDPGEGSAFDDATASGVTGSGATAPANTMEPDPFNPDVTMWPEPPSWLFPAIMVLVVLAVIAVIALVILWIKSVRYQRAEAAQKPKVQWVDLSKLDKKGRWADQDENPRAGGIDR